MIAARGKEREYFESSPDYAHLASRMGSVYLSKLLSQVPSNLKAHFLDLISEQNPGLNNFITIFSAS